MNKELCYNGPILDIRHDPIECYNEALNFIFFPDTSLFFGYCDDCILVYYSHVENLKKRCKVPFEVLTADEFMILRIHNV